MKLKRLAYYSLCVIGLCLVFTTCYYISFKNALNRFNESAVERDNKLLDSFTEYQKQQLRQQNMNQAVLVKDDDDVTVDQTDLMKISSNTKYVLQTYNIKSNELIAKELPITSELIGLTRNELLQLLVSYMQDMPIGEKNKGLTSYELISFSDRECVVRKSYNEDLVEFQYYVAVKEGRVIVFYSDLKTVYDFTDIEILNLQEKDRNDLMNGIYIKNEKELFSLLESYTS